MKNFKKLTACILLAGFGLITGNCFAQEPAGRAAGEPYPHMPFIAGIGQRIEMYIPVGESAKGPMIDPAKGYRVQDMGKGLYMITDNAYQSMFMEYEKGVVVIDAPPSLQPYILKAIADVTAKPVTHIIYSHAHIDHIGAAKSLG